MVLSEEEYGKTAGEWTSNVERQWKQKTQKAKEDMDRKQEPRVKLLRFRGRRWTYFNRPPALTLGTCCIKTGKQLSTQQKLKAVFILTTEQTSTSIFVQPELLLSRFSCNKPQDSWCGSNNRRCFIISQSSVPIWSIPFEKPVKQPVPWDKAIY